MDPEYKLLREFATDIMRFALAMNGYEYEGLFEIRDEWVPDTFEYVFGQAVFYYRESHREKFEELVQSYHDLIFHDEATLLDYIKFGIQKVTKKDSILMDFLRIMAFYADLIIYCQRFDSRKTYVALVSNYFTEIYNYSGIKDILRLTGSYGFLCTAAEEIIGERVYEEPFENRIMRYRQQLEERSPDRRRVSFALPEASIRLFSNIVTPSGSGRLASCLGMFANASEKNDFRENGLSEEDNHPGSKTDAANTDLDASSTTRISVGASSSTSSGEESKNIPGPCDSRKENFKEIKKPQSILKSPHVIKGHKRIASEEKASNKIKRTKTECSDETSSSPLKDQDPVTLTEEILIPISDSLSDDLKESLENILEEIFYYNKTNTESVIYAPLEGSENTSELTDESELEETGDLKSHVTEPAQSDFQREDLKSTLCKIEVPLTIITDDNSASKPDILKSGETKMSSESCDTLSQESEVDTFESGDSFINVKSCDPGCSNSSGNDSTKCDIGLKLVHTEISETKLVPEKVEFPDPEIPNASFEVKVSTVISDPCNDGKTELHGNNMNLRDCDINFEISEQGIEILKSLTSEDSVCESEVNNEVEITETNSNDCDTLSKNFAAAKIGNSAETTNKSDFERKLEAVHSISTLTETYAGDNNVLSENSVNDVNELVTSSDSICKSDTSKSVEVKNIEIKMDSDNEDLPSESSDTDVGRSDEPSKEITSSSESYYIVSEPKDVQEERVGSDENIVLSKSSDVNKQDDSMKIIKSSDSLCKQEDSKNVKVDKSEVRPDPDDNTFSDTDNSKYNIPSEIVTSSDHVKIDNSDAKTDLDDININDTDNVKHDISSEIVTSTDDLDKPDSTKNIQDQCSSRKLDSGDSDALLEKSEISESKNDNQTI